MQAKRFEALDGWRGLAALAVAFYHAPIAHPLRQASNWKNMEVFVDFFFVLSGFVILYAWGRRLDSAAAAKDFMAKRFWRIWPLHFAILMAFLVLELIKAGLQQVVTLPLDGAPFTLDRSWVSLVTNLFMVQSLNLHGTTTWNGPAWSISVEFWTYLVFAGVMLTCRRRLDLALLAVSAAGLALLATFSPIGLFATHDYGLPRAIYGFFLGAATCRLVMSGRARLVARSGGELAAIMLLMAYLYATGVNATSFAAPPVFALVILVFAQGQGLFSRVLESRPVQALGRWSYSIYLVHVILYYGLAVLFVVAQKAFNIPLTITGTGAQRLFSFGSGLADGAVLSGMLAVTVALAALTYRMIEKPFMVSSQPSCLSYGKPALA
jgi:peptidoglycan/LPS O-acetylase OafA/YrhL